MELQSILLPKDGICNVEEMYFHRDGKWLLFNGYFNLFYLEKHHKYCNIEELTLELELKGVKQLRIMHDDEVMYSECFEKKPIVDLEKLRMVKEYCAIEERDDTDQIKRQSIRIPYTELAYGVIWFKVEIDDRFDEHSESYEGKQWIVRGCFDGKRASIPVTVEQEMSRCQDGIEIGVNICTYKREKYVAQNMNSLIEWKKVREWPCSNGHEAARHLHVFIVDNGQTLDADKEFMSLAEGARIEVLPNPNTGGTGGFSRGMKEAMDRRTELGLTHLLFMDDDARFDPDIFVRLYGFLSMLRPEYKEITVGGAFFREDFPYIQHAAGEWFSNYKVINEHPLTDMRDFATCTSDWVTGTEKENSLYGAWWCCCYHMNAITEDNLPLPLFVHHDDIQFGMKQTDKGIVFLNGICVWHQGFELVFPGVKQYYNMRNTLITMKMFEPEVLLRTVKTWTVKRYVGLLISYRYGDCELVYRGYKDFLKGKRWLLSCSSEDLHKEITRIYRAFCDMKSIEDLCMSHDELVDVRRQIDEKSCRCKKDDEGQLYQKEGLEITPDQLRAYYSHDRFTGRFWKMLSINGLFLPASKGIKVITPIDSPWDVYRCKQILLYEPATGKGTMAKRNNREFGKAIIRIIDIMFSKL